MIDYYTLIKTRPITHYPGIAATQQVRIRRFLFALLFRFPQSLFVGIAAAVCLFVSPFAAAQQPRGLFLSDSVKIGNPVVYTLSLRHAPGEEVIFPDSGFDFAPFELVDKKFFPTRTDQSGSLDSVLYTLMTFEVDKVQRLSLPVYRISPKDCTALYTETDSVMLHEMITGPVDTLSLKANTRYRPIKPEFNYIYLALGLVGAIALVVLVFIVFGKRIRKQFLLYRMEKRHADFLQFIGRFHAGRYQGSATQMMEKVVVAWKQYVESLENKPYSTYTTKEIADRIADKSLVDTLKDIDRTIYGGQTFNAASRSFQTLQHFAVTLYIRRRKELRNQ